MGYDKTILAHNLRVLMAMHEERAADIARLLHVSKGTVSSWLAGEKVPRMDKIEILAQHYNVTISAILEQRDTGSISSAKQRPIDIVHTCTDAEAERLITIVEAVLGKTP